MAARELSPQHPNVDAPLTYPKISSDVWMQLLAAMSIVLSAVMIQSFSMKLPWSGDWNGSVLIDALTVQARGWAPYLLGESTWWFAAALAALAFMLPSALSASREDSPVSRVSLRGFYARLSRLVGGVSAAALFYALVGADYADPSVGIRLLLLSAATVVIVMVAALISSHEGYDALQSLESAITRAQEDLTLREPALAGRREEDGGKSPAVRALWLGLVEVIVLPLIGVLASYELVQVGLLPLTEYQIGAAISTWVCFSVSVSWSAAVNVISEFSPLSRWAAMVFMASVLGTIAAGVLTVRFVPAEMWESGLAWYFFAAGIALFVLLAVTFATLLSRQPLKGIRRFCFAGAVLETLAVGSERRVAALNEKIEAERKRRRRLEKEVGQPLLWLPGD